MKHFYIAVFSFFTGLTVYAQSVQIMDTLGNSIGGQTITIHGLGSETVLTEHFKVKQSTGATLSVKLKRYEMTLVPGSQNYFCWSLCYNPVLAGVKPYWEDLAAVSMITDSVYNNFSVYYKPNNKSGDAHYRFVLFDENNLNDSSYVDVIFSIPVGIAELNSTLKTTLAPNPANDFFKLSCESPVTSAEIYDLTGNRVMTIDPMNRNSRVDIRNLSSGIYFVQVTSVDGKIATSRLVKE